MMFSKAARVLPAVLLLTLSISGWAQSPPASAMLDQLQKMDVLHHWLAGHDRVDWKTGDPRPGAPLHDHRSTHCSAFVASAAQQFGIYILRPPDHSSTLLANAQYDWLRSQQGQQAGWTPVGSSLLARNLANQGNLVVAVYKSPDAAKSGHIALVIPSSWDDARVESEGCEIMQAGGHNYLSTSLQRGFGSHPGAFSKREILFFSHPVQSAQH